MEFSSRKSIKGYKNLENSEEKTINKERGFTLIELLVVIAILGILFSILLVSLEGARSHARDTKRVAEFRQISVALELYYSSHNSFPPLSNNIIDGIPTCSQDTTCLNISDTNWNNMITLLRNEKFLTMDYGQDSFENKVINLLFPKALASYPVIQDPLYKGVGKKGPRFEYMVNPSRQGYRLRAQLENKNTKILGSSLSGTFYYYDEPTGVDACDPNLKLYCAGTAGVFKSNVSGKPVIYLYPTHTEEVTVKVGAVSIDKSIPDYIDGWKILAHPDGELKNMSDGKNYPYLYWEGQSNIPIVNNNTGFVVSNKDIESFLMDSLLKQGLIKSEAKEFVDFWAPLISDKPYTYIYFMPQSDYDELTPLSVTPKPDTVIRVYMLWKGLDSPITVIPQKFTSPKRNGFTVVEWGGQLDQIH